MSVNLERAALKGRLAELDQNETRLCMRIESLVKAMRHGLNTNLTDVWDLEVPQLDEQWDIIKTSWGELIKVRADLQRLRKELQ